MKILGIFRGFPGLGRVVSGVALLEELRDHYACQIEIISYLQGYKFLSQRGYDVLPEATDMDYCSIGLLPTNKMGAYIHSRIEDYHPDVVIVDGEPLILQSLRFSYPGLKTVALLNPSDIDNPQNDAASMDFFKGLYSLADLAIVHGLRHVDKPSCFKRMLSLNTILRKEIFSVAPCPSRDIYCVLGGGTVNVGEQFSDSTLRIAKLCIEAAEYLPNYTMHIVCSSTNIHDSLRAFGGMANVELHVGFVEAWRYYTDSCLVITRSGRNTLSELAYLGIPAISFVAGCAYRQSEQLQNMKCLDAPNISFASADISTEDFVARCEDQICKGRTCGTFTAGNETAISSILSL